MTNYCGWEGRLYTPNLTGEAKTAYVEKAIAAAELSRQLHNALHHLLPDDSNDGHAAEARKRLQERLDAVEALENELLDHAMRVTLG